MWGRGEMPIVFWWGKLKGKDYFKNLHVDERIILKCILKK